MITYKQLQRVGAELRIIMDIDGELYQHRMPDTTLAIRAGEYGLDPVEDYEDVMDIIMWEMFVQHPEGTLYPPIVTAATLEEARDTVLAQCRAVKEQHSAPQARGVVDEDHEAVSAALKEEFVASKQLAELTREAMKDAVFIEKRAIQAAEADTRTTAQKAISKMQDELRQREGLHTSDPPGSRNVLVGEDNMKAFGNIRPVMNEGR
jgi:hypothetical protein